jgi:two-component system phosphate regulon sensor histidine kinase PhoR
MLADVSHELKTPLTAMAGYADTLAMAEVELDAATRARYLATIRHETTRLQRIVADLLDLARHENGVAALDVRLFDVEQVFEHLVRRHERDASAAGVSIRTQVSEGADQVLGDPDRIEQALGNLVANALRHTPTGGAIDLVSEVTPTTTRLSVVDSGTGIVPEHLSRVFERFYKVDHARTSGAGGSGLGLSIVKAIVERHGGVVDVTSRPGRTTFTIDLPRPS